LAALYETAKRASSLQQITRGERQGGKEGRHLLFGFVEGFERQKSLDFVEVKLLEEQGQCHLINLLSAARGIDSVRLRSAYPSNYL